MSFLLSKRVVVFYHTFLGFADSPADTPTISVPVIVNAAKTSALITPKTPCENAPGSFQYLNPYTVPLHCILR